MPNHVGGDYMYYDSVDCFSTSSEDSASMMEGRGCEYEIWMNEPKSVEYRRGSFLRNMGLGEFCFVDEDEALQRIREHSGAISLSGSWPTGEVDGSLASAGRETRDESSSHVDESDSLVLSSCDTGTETMPVGGICNESSYVKECVKATAKAKKISKWWSQLCKKPAGKGATEPALQMPKMNQTKVHRNKKKSMEFSAVYVGQEVKAHKGFILTMKFSPDGQYLASGGQDGVVRIWRVASKNACTKYSAPGCDGKHKIKFSSVAVPDKVFEIDEMPFQELYGHSGDILDLAWSKAN